MPKDDSTVCTEVINEIISRYSRVKNYEEGEKKDQPPEEETTRESESDFWGWFCESIKDSKFKKCFLDSDRDDFYGSMKSIREQYESKCK